LNATRSVAVARGESTSPDAVDVPSRHPDAHAGVRSPMRVLVHDYVGHPFQVQLSRSLARRGHTVRHVYSSSFQSPRGALERKVDDPVGFEVHGLSISESVEKYSLVKRRRQEQRYGKLLANDIRTFRPDVVLAANTPLDVLSPVQDECAAQDARFVLWLQDVYSAGIERVLRKKLPIIGLPVVRYYHRLERTLLRRSDSVVAITDDFRSMFPELQTVSSGFHVIPNWAPLEEVPSSAKANEWTREHGLDDKFCFMYSGTLGLKHNPDLLVDLAKHFRDNPAVVVVVISEGIGADWLRARCAEQGLENLLILDYQPFSRMPEVLGAADVLLAILEPDAGVFSVPSKVLTYLCAQRPLLLAVPPENLAARTVVSADAGVVVPPAARPAFVREAEQLYQDADRRREMGVNARAYAERTFDIERITNSFESILWV
jgi:colanic acid biosynthesis glycosyl transferase WcaI